MLITRGRFRRLAGNKLACKSSNGHVVLFSKWSARDTHHFSGSTLRQTFHKQFEEEVRFMLSFAAGGRTFVLFLNLLALN
jgi:hypothetical protein